VPHRPGRGVLPALTVFIAAWAALTACHSPAPAATVAPAPVSTAESSAPAIPSSAVSSVDVPPEQSDVIPDVTGRRLSDAEQILGNAGFMQVRAVDASGQGRSILEKNNWLVERQDPPAGSPASTGVSIILGAVKPTDDVSAAAARKGIVPGVVCHDLQEAQATMRAAGFYVLLAKDGLGQHRYPLVDRNWIVVGQSASPGSSPRRTATIELTVVKFGEPTGSSGCKS
jgi:PASTA domain-containing protein